LHLCGLRETCPGESRRLYQIQLPDRRLHLKIFFAPLHLGVFARNVLLH
jgi:hypothetical protein